jgi:hypothetical protein
LFATTVGIRFCVECPNDRLGGKDRRAILQWRGAPPGGDFFKFRILLEWREDFERLLSQFFYDLRECPEREEHRFGVARHLNVHVRS